LFKIELKCGDMENKIVTRSLRRQLDLVIIHEQMENGTAINSNIKATVVSVCVGSAWKILPVTAINSNIKATMVSVCVGSAWKILPVTTRSLWSWYILIQ
jgi:hypothetical protein